MGEIIWQPGPNRVCGSRMFHFLHSVKETFSRDISNYSELHHWSIEQIDRFWDFYRTYSGIHFRRPPEQILSSRQMPGALWFEGAELNYAENLLQADPNKTAIFCKVENRPLDSLTYGELTERIKQFAAALEHHGIQAGDRVAGYLPNIPQTVIAMLGSASIGAVWTSCSPDFGPQGVLDRFGQVEPALLVCTDGYHYNGNSYSTLHSVKTLIEKIPSLKHIVVVPFLDSKCNPRKIGMAPASTWEEFLVSGNSDTFRFLPLPFNHPLFILYSSGTTGLPKSIVHGAGGTLLQHHKEQALHTDIGPEDVVFYFSTCGWMMWNWLISALAQHAAIVLYEGCPGFPSLRTLWELIDEAAITIFGTSAKFISANQKQRFVPKEIVDLHTLRTILSTGSPLSPDNFYWVYGNVKKDVQLSSICGGTDIVSCFVLGNPLLPVRAGEIQCLGLGMDVVALNAGHQPVLNQKGELACRQPVPCMPLAFWGDEDNKKYRKTYFDQVPGVWIHGDFIEIRDHGGVVVYGRSDATLNPGGVRIGTSEIYRVVEKLEEVVDSIAIGVDEENDIRIFLFVLLRQGLSMSASLERKIRQALRRETSPRHVPDKIFAVQDIPRTLNGKKVELELRHLFQGKNPENLASLENPKCLAEYEELFKATFPSVKKTGQAP